MCLSGPTIILGAVVVVVLCWLCAVTVVWVAEVASAEVVGTVVAPLCAVAAGAVLVAEFPLFFFAFAVDVVCAVAIDAVTRNALIQKLAANFKYLFITSSPEPGFDSHRLSSTPTPPHPVDTTSAAPYLSSCGPPPAVVQTIYSSLLRQI
jgi:hypothetical protein